MKTILPESISTVKEAKAFLTDLHNNNEAYHPEDSAKEIIWKTCNAPTPEECEHLDKLMNDIYSIEGNQDCQNMICDPCEVLNNLDNE